MKAKGLTLVELLILMLFINILAGISVPNYMEAKIRSDVSRVKSDLRILAASIEAYQMDWKVPAPQSGQGLFPPLLINGKLLTVALTSALTTPVGYLTTFPLYDSFSSKTSPLPYIFPYTYHCYNWLWWDKNDSWMQPFGDRLDGYQFKYYYSGWRLFSIGPDMEYDNIPGGSQYTTPSPFGMPYDPTNGTISTGNIIRSQKYSEQKTWKDSF